MCLLGVCIISLKDLLLSSFPALLSIVKALPPFDDRVKDEELKPGFIKMPIGGNRGSASTFLESLIISRKGILFPPLRTLSSHWYVESC